MGSWVEGEVAWDAARRWAASGVMALCGHPDGPPLLPPLVGSLKLSDVVDEIERLTAATGAPVRVSWEAALTGRASLLGLTRRGTTSPNGASRLLQSSDSHFALSLPRSSDIELLPALLAGSVPPGDAWEAVGVLASHSKATDMVSRARLLGMAAAVPGERHDMVAYHSTGRGNSSAVKWDRAWKVVDLSALWAGPLCARILAEAGARVVKVEDRCRPDGARRSPSFYRWIHPVAERGVRIDFNSADGRRALGTLLDSADVVIEASRARALEQIGFSPEQRDGPDGQIWLSITAHGRSGDARNWIGFGDDTAVAGGFMCRDADGGAAFCGDAIADPITGLVGALAVLRARHEGGGQLIDLSLSGAASWAGAGELDGPAPVVEPADGGWQVSLGGRSIRVADRPASAVLVAGP